MDHYLNCHSRMAATNKLSFQITRHATSCYNIDAYPFITYPKIVGLGSADGIPSLAKYGIDETIRLAETEKDKPRFQSSIVCASNLVRTWMTAILLYTLYDNTKDNKTKNPITAITLRICPYLKEIGKKGNGAYPLTQSIPKFIEFLNLIRTNDKYKQLKEIHLLIPKLIEPPHRNWVKIIITIPKDKLADTIIHEPAQFCDKTKVIDVIPGYNNDGNISEFMTWFSRSFPEERGLIHVVAHSHIMKAYFNEKCKNTITPEGKKFDIKKHTLKEPVDISTVGIDAQNCWTFTTTSDVDPKILIESIQHGYANPDKVGKDPNEPKSEEEGSLCRKKVEKITCSTKGGYYTKKNRRKSCKTSRRTSRKI